MWWAHSSACFQGKRIFWGTSENADVFPHKWKHHTSWTFKGNMGMNWEMIIIIYLFFKLKPQMKYKEKSVVSHRTSS